MWCCCHHGNPSAGDALQHPVGCSCCWPHASLAVPRAWGSHPSSLCCSVLLGVLNCSNFNQLVGCSETQSTHDVRRAMWQLPGKGQCENGSAQVVKGQQDPAGHCRSWQGPCVVTFAYPSPSSTLLAAIPPSLRRELDLLLPSSCSQQPSRMC